MNVKKPKPPLFISRRHVEETVVELKTDYPTALNRLRQMGGAGCDRRWMDDPLWSNRI